MNFWIRGSEKRWTGGRAEVPLSLHSAASFSHSMQLIDLARYLTTRSRIRMEGMGIERERQGGGGDTIHCPDNNFLHLKK